MIIEKHSLNVYFKIMIVMKTFFFFYKWTVYNAKSTPATNAYSNSMHFADAFINVTYIVFKVYNYKVKRHSLGIKTICCC